MLIENIWLYEQLFLPSPDKLSTLQFLTSLLPDH